MWGPPRKQVSLVTSQAAIEVIKETLMHRRDRLLAIRLEAESCGIWDLIICGLWWSDSLGAFTFALSAGLAFLAVVCRGLFASSTFANSHLVTILSHRIGVLIDKCSVMTVQRIRHQMLRKGLSYKVWVLIDRDDCLHGTWVVTSARYLIRIDLQWYLGPCLLQL